MRDFFVRNQLKTPIKTLQKEQEQLTSEIFDLMYYGNFSYLDLMLMPIHERRRYTDLLVTTKRKENEEQEKALAKMKAR